MNFLVGYFCRNIACCNFKSEPFGNGSLADTGFTYKTRVVLCSAAQYLNRSVNFLISANNSIKLTLSCAFRKIGTIKI